MPPSKLKKAIDAVKDQTSIGLARVNTSTSISDIEVAIVKATQHKEYPADERHIRELLSLTSYSRANVSVCVNTLSRRLNKTKNWVVALKTLMLIQRLISDGDSSYEQEIFFATRRGTRFLNMSDFRDASRSSSGWDYSAFVRTYALYMDEQLEFRMQGKRGKRVAFASYEDEEKEEEEWEDDRGNGKNGTGTGTGRGRKNSRVIGTPVQDLRTERLFSRLQHLMQLLERFLACRPTGSAKQNRLVSVALYPLVKESFTIYYDLIEVQHILMDRFVGLEVSDCAKAYEIFCRMAKQFDELDSFYGWSKSAGIARSSEYPEVDQVPQKSLELMDEYIRDRSGSMLKKKATGTEIKTEKEEEKKKPEVVEEDMNDMRALPPPEGWEEEEKKKEDEEVEKPPAELAVVQKEVDLLNLGEDEPTNEAHGDQLALALFDGVGNTTGNETSTQPWEAFKDTENWETTLVQTASHLPNQKTSFTGGFDMMLLDSMYQQGATTQAASHSGYVATGSASSVAVGSAGRPAMLALPAPPTSAMGPTNYADPFYASVPVPPPPYVQMTEMENKQRLLMQEQVMWEQYRMDQMQGQGAYNHHMQPNPYPNHMGVVIGKKILNFLALAFRNYPIEEGWFRWLTYS